MNLKHHYIIQRSDAFCSHNCHQFHLQAPTFEIRLNVVKCRRFFKNGKKIISSEFIKKLIIATFIPGTKYSEENLFLPRAQSEREREKNSTSLWLLTFLKDRALGVGETRISLKCDTSSRQTFPGLIPTDDQEICLS